MRRGIGKRGKFSLSNYKLFSCDPGYLVPCGLVEVLPGDTLQQATSALVRAMPLNAPVMHPVDVRIHHWYVPLRLIWEDFEDFITGGPDGNDTSAFPTIKMSFTAPPASGSGVLGGLGDYLGVPPGIDQLEVSALPFRAYAMIFNEWYRDQDLVNEVPWSEASGVDTTTNTDLLRIAWEKDYFTSARPWEQKGPSITVPIGTDAPVRLDAISNPGSADGKFAVSARANDGTASNNFGDNYGVNDGAIPTNSSFNLFADLTGVSSVTVTLLREAMALQRYEEARARFGSRYTEYLRYLGVQSSDARLQRPEYLGGGRQTIQFSEVLQTAEGSDPVGEMRGHGIAAMRSNRYRRFFEEHGYVLSLMSVRPKTIYAQGLARHWNRRTKEDFFQKELQHIGQQEVLYKELYAAHSTPDGTFGWQDRYDEYRRIESTIAGEFRDTTLDYWHMARIFSTDPALNSDFVQCNPTDRVFASQSTDKLLIMAKHSIQARRLVAQTGKSFIY